MRKGLAVLAGIAVLVVINLAIAGKERLLADGRVVFLELAPVDPRSLMQGDYMALRFAIADEVMRARSEGEPPPADGALVAVLDDGGVARFRRVHGGEALAGDELLLRYRVRGSRVKFATNAFFFQEGHAEYYEPAEYGEFRVGADGELLLTGLRDADLQPLGPPR